MTADDFLRPRPRWLVVQPEWVVPGQIGLDLVGIADSREQAVSIAESRGGFVIAADWWPAPEPTREDES